MDELELNGQAFIGEDSVRSSPAADRLSGVGSR